MSVEVMCALCGEPVEDIGVDPCALIVVGKWRAHEDDQREQQFFAHAACLSAALHPDARVHADVLDGRSEMYRS